MNVGKTLFAQVMEFVPWKTFGRIVERHKGDAGVRTLSCADLFRVMAFAQLTWRESLRDIEACLAANQAKLFHMGLKAPPARSTLSDALNQRDWRIYHALAQRLIARARALYAQEACKTVVGLLVLAADGHEAQLATELEQLIELDQLPDLTALTALLAPRPGVVPIVKVELPDLAGFDALLGEQA